jgi:hypothetical protein
MNVNAKLGYAVQAVQNIARHDDATFELREAALQHIVATIVAETITMRARHDNKLAAQIAALTPPERA